MLKKVSKIKKLQGKIASAIGIITNTISTLEQTNVEFEKVKEELDLEIENTTRQHLVVTDTINQNTKIIENFKNLLK